MITGLSIGEVVKMEIIIVAIIAGISAIITASIAFFGYDRVRKNQQKYHAWQIIIEKKISIFLNISDCIQKMGRGMLFKRMISVIEEEAGDLVHAPPPLTKLKKVKSEEKPRDLRGYRTFYLKNDFIKDMR